MHEQLLCPLTDREANRDGLPHLMLTSRNIISGDVKIKGSLGYSDHEVGKFKILRAARKAKSQAWASEECILASLKTCLEEVQNKKGLRKLVNV